MLSVAALPLASSIIGRSGDAPDLAAHGRLPPLRHALPVAAKEAVRRTLLSVEL